MRTYILADAQVANLVGARMYPRMLPQTPILPALVFQRIDTRRLHSTWTAPTVCRAPPADHLLGRPAHDDAATVAQAMRARLDGVTGTIGASTIGASLHRQRDVTDAEAGRVGGLDFLIHYQENLRMAGKAAFGTTIAFGTGTSPTAVASVTEISGLDGDTEVIDVTAHDSGGACRREAGQLPGCRSGLARTQLRSQKRPTSRRPAASSTCATSAPSKPGVSPSPAHRSLRHFPGLRQERRLLRPLRRQARHERLAGSDGFGHLDLRYMSGLLLDIGAGMRRIEDGTPSTIYPIPASTWCTIQHNARLLDGDCAVAPWRTSPSAASRAGYALLRFMNRYRLLQPGGEFLIVAPTASNQAFLQEPTFCNPVIESTFTPSTRNTRPACGSVYQPAPWRIVSLEWDAATVLEVTFAAAVEHTPVPPSVPSSPDSGDPGYVNRLLVGTPVTGWCASNGWPPVTADDPHQLVGGPAMQYMAGTFPLRYQVADAQNLIVADAIAKDMEWLFLLGA